MKTLIIVESPNKASAVARYVREVIPGEVTVRACLGHLRDLPPGKLAIDIENGFRPDYQVMPNRGQTIAILRQAIRQADRVILASDLDREGEAVAWHVSKVFKAELQGKAVTRIRLNAITRSAVQSALASPHQINCRLVQAAVARRVMDRLVGYTLSPKLWREVKGRDHSAGRVQSVALRLLQEHLPEKIERWLVEVEI